MAEPKKPQKSDIDVVSDRIYEAKAFFEAVRVDSNMAFTREAEFAVHIMMSNPFTREVALANPNSLQAAITNVGAIGLSLNPALKLAYLVPRDGRVCLDISYLGMIDLALRSGSILWAQANVVREADTFKLHGLDKHPTHDHEPFKTDRGAIVGAYVCVKTVDGDYLTHAMTTAEIFAIRDRSDYWRKKKDGPWKNFETEMMKKTVIKQASKLWPHTDRLDKAIEYLNTDGGEGIEFGDVPPADACPPELLELAKAAADKGIAEYEIFFRGLLQEARKQLARHHENLKARAVRADDNRTINEETHHDGKE